MGEHDFALRMVGAPLSTQRRRPDLHDYWTCTACPLPGSYWPTPALLKWHAAEHHGLRLKHCADCGEYGLTEEERNHHRRHLDHLLRDREPAESLVLYAVLIFGVLAMTALTSTFDVGYRLLDPALHLALRVWLHALHLLGGH